MESQVQQPLTLYRYKRTNKCLHQDLDNDLKLTLMLIPAGEFWMGAQDDEPESRDSEKPRHLVKIPQPFLMGRYPVTQAQWRVVAGYPKKERALEAEPSRFKGDNRPVEKVSWDDAVEFCRRISAKTDKTYRLPTEAEWEYACRAGTETPFHYGATITTEVANHNGDYTYNDGLKGIYRAETTDVGSFEANRWGLCDMHGNVWEWCQDYWHQNYHDAPEDGSAWMTEDNYSRHVLRGGSWGNDPRGCRSAYRLSLTRDGRYLNVGFRVCCVLPRTQTP